MACECKRRCEYLQLSYITFSELSPEGLQVSSTWPLRFRFLSSFSKSKQCNQPAWITLSRNEHELLLNDLPLEQQPMPVACRGLECSRFIRPVLSEIGAHKE